MSRIAGLAIVAVLMVLVAAFPARAQVQEPPQDAHGGRHRRLGLDRRPARHPDGDRRPALRRQRRRRRGRGSRRARRDRAVLVRHRRRRLHGHLRRQAPQGRHHRLARGGARRRWTRTPFAPYIGGYGQVPARARQRSQRRRPRHRPPAGRPRSSATAPARCARCSSPAERIADEGFLTDETFAGQVKSNEAVFADFTSSRETYLNPDGTAPPAGLLHRNPDMAETYRRIGRNPDRFYRGGIARDIAPHRAAAAGDRRVPPP